MEGREEEHTKQDMKVQLDTGGDKTGEGSEWATIERQALALHGL